MTSTDVVETKKSKEFKMKTKKGKGKSKGRAKGKGKGKGKKNKGIPVNAVDAGIEHHGVAVIYRKKWMLAKSGSNRLMVDYFRYILK